MKHKNGWRPYVAAALLACSLPFSAAAQEGSTDYKQLYAAAEYEKALAVLASFSTAEAHQYKALCLLALGRQDDAGAAVKELVSTSPTFIPSAEEAPPRFVELVSDVRKTMLPAIARRIFAEGREQFTGKEHEKAVEKFALVLTLASDPDFEDASAAQDLKTLAQGFIDLARAAIPPPPAPVAAVEEKPAQPTPPPAPATPPKVVQAVPIEQRVPGVPSEVVGSIGPALLVIVQIDEMGKVTSAEVRQSAHPLYDRMVLQAARDWVYTPATLNGTPIPSERQVTIQTGR